MAESLEIRVFWYRVSTYTATAAISLWTYDYVLTVADELELLWSRNGLFIKSLYLAGRYLPIAGMAFIGNSIFTTRLCAIYFMRRYFRRFLILSLLLSIIALLVFVILNLIHLLPDMMWAAHVRACITPSYHNWSVGASYVTPIFMESLIFFATLFHAFEHKRIDSKVSNSRSGALLHRLYVDGIQYYLVRLMFSPPEIFDLLTWYDRDPARSSVSTRYDVQANYDETTKLTGPRISGIAMRRTQRTGTTEFGMDVLGSINECEEQ
ncbi:hypothetical protein FRC17_000454 [Serendipita sp. 399]|nr:hypothetical protein FRC17_000454 [Serendipita sp. 399]